MFGDRVRSSDLETGLSSSEETVAQEMDIALSLILTFQASKEKCGHSCQIVNRIVNQNLIFLYRISYRIVNCKIHKHLIKL